MPNKLGKCPYCGKWLSDMHVSCADDVIRVECYNCGKMKGTVVFDSPIEDDTVADEFTSKDHPSFHIPDADLESLAANTKTLLRNMGLGRELDIILSELNQGGNLDA